MRKESSLIIYELNEIPQKVIVHYIRHKPKSFLAKICRETSFVETVTTDKGELHPWSSWPTFHRGVNNEVHKIKYLNQDLDSARNHPPIWEKLKNSGISIGIFGSLQSYPPLSGDKVSFFVPDTFSPSRKSYPTELEKFQKFNLSLTKRNTAHARSFQIKDVLNFLDIMLNNLVSISTVFRIVRHIISEKVNDNFKKRRSLLQPLIGFDVYYKYLYKNKPRFSTFFSNHVAGIMHRYWKDSFPEDFGMSKENIDYKEIKFNQNSLFKSMDIADKQIKKLYNLQKDRQGKLWIVSALGQQAKEWGDYIPEIALKSEQLFLNKIQCETKKITFVPSMHPDLNFHCDDNKNMKDFIENLNELRDLDNKKILIERYKPINNTFNFTIQSTKSISESKSILYKGKKYSLFDFGFEFVKRDNGTGYHINKGIFISSDPRDIDKLSSYNKKTDSIDTTLFHNYILSLFKI